MNVPLDLPFSLQTEIAQLNNKGMVVKIKDESFYKEKDILNKDNLDIPSNGFVIFHNGALFIYNYVPDNTSVKDKLLYANGEMILINKLSTHVNFVNKLSEITFTAISEDKVLTHEERHKIQVRKEELLMDMGKVKMVGSGIPFELTPQVKDALNGYKHAGTTLKIEDEVVDLLKTFDNFDQLISFLKSQKLPVYAYWRDTQLFISYCPSSACIKDRMIFTTAKQHVQSLFPKEANRVEASEPDELPTQAQEEILPEEKANQPRKKISAPGKRTLL